MLREYEQRMRAWAEREDDPPMPEYPMPPLPGEDLVNYLQRWWLQMEEEGLLPITSSDYVYDMCSTLVGNVSFLDGELRSWGGAALDQDEVSELQRRSSVRIDDIKGLP